MYSSFFLAALCFFLPFSSTTSHFLIIFCVPVWIIRSLLPPSECFYPFMGPFMGLSPSGVPLLQCVAHRPHYVLWQRAPPSKNAFPSRLQQCPLPHASLHFVYPPVSSLTYLFLFPLMCGLMYILPQCLRPFLSW